MGGLGSRGKGKERAVWGHVVREKSGRSGAKWAMDWLKLKLQIFMWLTAHKADGRALPLTDG